MTAHFGSLLDVPWYDEQSLNNIYDIDSITNTKLITSPSKRLKIQKDDFEFERQGFIWEQMKLKVDVLASSISPSELYFKFDTEFDKLPNDMKKAWSTGTATVGCVVKLFIPYCWAHTGKWMQSRVDKLSIGEQTYLSSRDDVLVFGRVVATKIEESTKPCHWADVQPWEQNPENLTDNIISVPLKSLHVGSLLPPTPRSECSHSWFYTVDSFPEDENYVPVGGQRIKLYDEETNQYLTDALGKLNEYKGRGLLVNVPIKTGNGQCSHYHIDLMTMKQINPRTHTARGVLFLPFSYESNCTKELHDIWNRVSKYTKKKRNIDVEMIKLQDLEQNELYAQYAQCVPDIKKHIGHRLLGIIRVNNKMTTHRFEQKVEMETTLRAKTFNLPFDRVSIMYHGFQLENLEGIIQDGVDPSRCTRCRYGKGAYASKNLHTATSYTDQAGQVKVVAIVQANTGVYKIVEADTWSHPYSPPMSNPSGRITEDLTGERYNCTTNSDSLDITCIPDSSALNIFCLLIFSPSLRETEFTYNETILD